MAMNAFRYLTWFPLILSSVVYGANTGTIILVSDLHYDTELSNKTYPLTSQDANQSFLDKVIGSAAYSATKNNNKPDFILITGDFAAHEISGGRSSKVYNAVQHTLSELWSTQNAVLLRTPIYAALGNNDSYTGDYQLDSGSFFNDMKFLLQTYAFPDGQVPADYDADYSKYYGSYTANIPATCESSTGCKRVMVLNTVPFSDKTDRLICDGHHSTCSEFRKNIVEFVNNNETPNFVAMHIADSPSYGWNQSADYQISSNTSLFASCSNEIKNCTKAIFAGHWHYYNRSVTTASDPGLVKTVLLPSVTPRNGAKPGYLIITYDRDTGKKISGTHYYISDYSGTLAGKSIDKAITWSKEDF